MQKTGISILIADDEEYDTRPTRAHSREGRLYGGYGLRRQCRAPETAGERYDIVLTDHQTCPTATASR